MAQRRVVKSWVMTLCISVALLLVNIFGIAVIYYRAPADKIGDELDRMSTCRGELLQWLEPKDRKLETWASIQGLCYSQTNEEEALKSFGITQSALVRQQHQVPAMMWMVIAITISGVALSAVQLLISFRLVSAGKGTFEAGGEMSVGRDKLVLKTSVTGVLILVISLGFFYVFVKEVYLIKVIQVPPSDSVSPHPDLRAGWMIKNDAPAFAPAAELKPGGIVLGSPSGPPEPARDGTSRPQVPSPSPSVVPRPSR